MVDLFRCIGRHQRHVEDVKRAKQPLADLDHDRSCVRRLNNFIMGAATFFFIIASEAAIQLVIMDIIGTIKL